MSGSKELFVELANEASGRNADVLARQLGILYDGAVVGASMERDAKVPREARRMAEQLLDAASDKQEAFALKEGGRPLEGVIRGIIHGAGLRQASSTRNAERRLS